MFLTGKGKAGEHVENADLQPPGARLRPSALSLACVCVFFTTFHFPSSASLVKRDMSKTQKAVARHEDAGDGRTDGRTGPLGPAVPTRATFSPFVGD